MHELPINKQKLNGLIKKAKHYNISPLLLPTYSYDKNKHPISPLLIELADEAEGLLKTTSESEIDTLIESLPAFVAAMIEERDSTTELNKFIKKVAIYYIVAEVHRGYFPFKDTINEDIQDSIVLKKFPELKTGFDKDGLLKISEEFTLHTGGIEYKNYILHYHRLLRRGYTAKPNFDFFGRLIFYYDKSKTVNTLRIAIDHKRLMPIEEYSRIIELDRWYGPPFDQKKLDDPVYVGLTEVKRNKDSLFELNNHLDRTEFFWSYKDKIKTLEIEELSDIDYTFETYIFNKYIHSERDIENQITRHLDGAVKIYLETNYHKRFATRMPDEFKCHKKIKLWRIDGNIDLENWKDLISHFYKSNEMILEYFSPGFLEKTFEPRVLDYKKWKSQQPAKSC